MQELLVQKEIGNNWNDWYYMNLRGIYIGDYFYLVNQIKEVCSYRMGQDGFSDAKWHIYNIHILQQPPLI